MDVPTVTGDRLALVGGHSLADASIAAAGTERTVTTPFGAVELLETADFVLLRRHFATGTFVPAHLLDHRAGIAALAAAGCDRVLALASVGSLRADWPVGTIATPVDFYAPSATESFYDDFGGHSVPGFDVAWRATVRDTWHEVTQTPIEDRGVYAQTPGPRFETPTEAHVLAAHADVVGMTVASECILAKEAGLAYACLCTVDNLANGISGEQLSVDEFRANVAHNQQRLLADLGALLPRLAATPRPANGPS